MFELADSSDLLPLLYLGSYYLMPIVALIALLAYRRVTAGVPLAPFADRLASGRRASVSTFDDRSHARFVIDVPGDLHASFRARFRGGVEIGSADQARTDAILAGHPEVERDVLQLLRLGFDHILLLDGKLTATARLSRIEQGDVPKLLAILDGIAAAFDTSPVHAHARPGATRCSYCHAPAPENEAVACGQCSTLLHAACWQELGRCPVLGCRGGLPAKIRVA